MFIISSIIFPRPGDNGDGNHLTPSGDGAGPAHSNLFLYSVSDYLSLKLYWSSEYIWWNSIPWVSIFIRWGTVFCNVIFVSEINSPSSTWSYFLLLSTSCWTNSWLGVKNLDDRSSWFRREELPVEREEMRNGSRFGEKWKTRKLV